MPISRAKGLGQKRGVESDWAADMNWMLQRSKKIRSSLFGIQTVFLGCPAMLHYTDWATQFLHQEFLFGIFLKFLNIFLSMRHPKLQNFTKYQFYTLYFPIRNTS
jgi:hypothetical protein